MNSSIYALSFRKLAVLLTPMALRRPLIIAILSAISTAISETFAGWTQYRKQKLEELKYNGQVCRLEYCLNQQFPSETGSRIRVEDGQYRTGEPFYIYPRTTLLHTPMLRRRGDDEKQIILSRRDDVAERQYDFFVYVPTDNPVNQRRFSAIINNYKTPGRIWKMISNTETSPARM